MRVRLTSEDKQEWMKKPILAGAYRHWLIDDGSLTLKLQQRHPNFLVKPISVGYTKPMQDERVLLHLKTAERALVREVVLISNGQPVVFAHSVISRDSLYGEWLGFTQLGNRSLGAALFANPKVKRTTLSYKKLSKQHALYKQAVKQLIKHPQFLWARRSIFSLHCANILVTEIFLPTILEK